METIRYLICTLFGGILATAVLVSAGLVDINIVINKDEKDEDK